MEQMLREYEQRIKELETSVETLKGKLEEQEKMRRMYVDGLDQMKGSLNNLQELLMKCRADMLLHEMMSARNGEPLVSKLEVKSPSLEMEMISLQTQLEVCRNELAEERDARQELITENHRLTVEMQMLLHKNHQLCVEAQTGVADSSSTAISCSMRLYGASPGNNFERQIAPCPHCNNVFGDFQTLETHIEDCPGLVY